MKRISVSKSIIKEFAAHLNREEKSEATIEKYVRYAGAFLSALGSAELTKEAVIDWKRGVAERYTAAGANGMISSVNSFLRFLGRPDMCVKRLKVQRRTLRTPERTLDCDAMDKLIAAAERLGHDQTALMMRTMVTTGIRASELPFITFEAASAGTAEVSLKGKTREVYIKTEIRLRLLNYATQQCKSLPCLFASL